MITDKEIEMEIGRAHMEMFHRYMKARVDCLNELWGKRMAKIHLQWGGLALLLIGIIIYLLIKSHG